MGKTSDDAVPAVRSWRGRRGLALAVVLPALAIASFSTVHLVSALGSAGAAARAGALARLTADSTGLAAALEAERNETVRFVALGAPPYGVIGRGSARTSDPGYKLEQAVLHRAFAATDRSARQVTAAARAIGGSYPAVVRRTGHQRGGGAGEPGRTPQELHHDEPSLPQHHPRVQLGNRRRAGHRRRRQPGPGRGGPGPGRAGANADRRRAGGRRPAERDPDLRPEPGPHHPGRLRPGQAQRHHRRRQRAGSRAGGLRRHGGPAAAAAVPGRDVGPAGDQGPGHGPAGDRHGPVGRAGPDDRRAPAPGFSTCGAGLGHVEGQLESAEQSMASTLHTRAVLSALGYSLLLAILAAMLFTVFRPRLPRRA